MQERPDSPSHAALIPDGCNTGVVFRTLLAVNLAAVLALWASAANRTILVQNFLDQVMLIEWGTLGSLLLLCAARRLAARLALGAGLQRLLCAALPAMLLGALAWGLAALEQLAEPEWLALRAAVLAAVAGLLAQAWFALRARAYSPVLAEARLQALQARIRPHFLFNTLNAVLAMIRAQPRQAERTLEDLADLFRVAMQDARTLTTLAQEIDLCERYLAIEQLRLGERLQVRWRVAAAAALGRLRVPALILQPLLENAVHHGVEQAAGPAEIVIDIARSGEHLDVTIANPLHERPGPHGNHMALANIRERLALLYDVEARLAVAREDGRFVVRLHIPIAGALAGQAPVAEPAAAGMPAAGTPAAGAPAAGTPPASAPAGDRP